MEPPFEEWDWSDEEWKIDYEWSATDIDGWVYTDNGISSVY
jgi:hypothetical protein